ncbi:unnamed protein product [Lepeophtheirus salmonis]|uniref:(salmon louse) hypothetical protein n=1 Tax=Lepeophtheirus salmonis TaxID=72036 RepID=A0A7R8D4B2_LEPSM|nr:unnamed protein product [Lepeophtheirus salmonis]CAF3023712.1 unnamed protein product [Lepeophtheirus salmonis]
MDANNDWDVEIFLDSLLNDTGPKNDVLNGGDSSIQDFKLDLLSSPETPFENTKKCVICYQGEAADCSFYGGKGSCISCRAFFGRAVKSKSYTKFKCSESGKLKCIVDSKSRKSCKHCRFYRCVNVAHMKTGLVKLKGEIFPNEISMGLTSEELKIYASPWASSWEIEENHKKLQNRILHLSRNDPNYPRDPILYTLLILMLLFFTDGVEFEDPNMVEKLHLKYSQMLYRYLRSNMTQEKAQLKYAQCLLLSKDTPCSPRQYISVTIICGVWVWITNKPPHCKFDLELHQKCRRSPPTPYSPELAGLEQSILDLTINCGIPETSTTLTHSYFSDR